MNKRYTMPDYANAFLIGNDGLGDGIVLSGMINYLSTKYDFVFVACIQKYYEQIKLYYNRSNIIVYPIDWIGSSNMYEFSILMGDFRHIYDIYYVGNYGAKEIDMKKYIKKLPDNSITKIIYNYPISYYVDANIPIEYMTTYFSVSYPTDISNYYDELLTNYPKFRVIHQIGSNASINILSNKLFNIDDMLTIDVNQNVYPENHKYHAICNKFINLRSIIYYAKLLENASELYLIDSCIHALALIVNIQKAFPRICFKRESRFNYGFPDKFKYYLLIFHSNPLQ